MRAIAILSTFAVCLAACSPADVEHADLILHNGTVVTVNDAFDTAEAVAVAGTSILTVGTNERILAMRGPDTVLIDLGGRVVLPGLGDSHNHMSGVGMSLLFPSLEGSESIADIANVIAAAAEETPEGEWIQTATIGEPAISALLKERRYPNRWDLDPVSPNHPVLISAPHVSILNSAGLRVAGITRDTKDPAGGEIVRDPETGEPTGVLLERAQSLVQGFLPPVTDAMRDEALARAMAEYNRSGLTSIVQHGITPDFVRAFQRLWAAGRMTVRVTLFPYVDAGRDLGDIEEELEALSAFASYPGFGDEFLRIAGIKLGFDGGVGIGTALQREPYRGPGGESSYGIQRIPDDKFAAIVRLAVENNLRVAVHASGGGAMDKVFATFEKLQETRDLTPMRHVAVHAQLPTERNFAQVKNLGLAIAAQPIFQYSMGNGYVKYLGKALADRSNPMRTWYENSIPVALGSDAPVNPHSPLLGIWYTQTRLDKATGEVLGADQTISREQALIGYTRNVAFSTFEEEVKGSIEPGKLADMIVLDRDLLSCPVDEIKDIEVLMTIVGGKIVYRRGDAI